MASTAPYYQPAQSAAFAPQPPNADAVAFTRDAADAHLDSSTDNASLFNRLTREINGGGDVSAVDGSDRLQSRQQHPAIDGNLLEAVTSAAGQESRLGRAAEGAMFAPSTEMDRQQRTAEEAVSLMGRGKRKRASEGRQPADPNDVGLQFKNYSPVNGSAYPRKRTRQAASLASAAEIDDGDAHGQSPAASVEDSHIDDSSFMINEYPPAISMSDARAAGVYSAAALFRKPSTASKKYTRPPMSKLFTSLELTPETFLRLQAAAKSYMLDPDHPERQDCVGNRSKGDGDMIKLRLYHCVKDFLDAEGHGETYFGRDSEGASRRPFSWPKDANKVISLTTPLLRRMVTNERQRQYAVETRKGGSTGGKGSSAGPNDAAADDASGRGGALNNLEGGSHSTQHQHVGGGGDAQLDPFLSSYGSMAAATATAAVNNAAVQASYNLEYDGLILRFVVISNQPHEEQTQILSRFDIPVEGCRDFSVLREIAEHAALAGLAAYGAGSSKASALEAVQAALAPQAMDVGGDPASTSTAKRALESLSSTEQDDAGGATRASKRRRRGASGQQTTRDAPLQENAPAGGRAPAAGVRISAFGAGGLVSIADDAAWRAAVEAAEATVWMESALKLVVEI